MSTNKQENSIDSQRNVLIPYAESHNMEILNEYCDSGISGRSADKRPAFLQMIEDSLNRDFDTVLIYDSSRFARNLEESLIYKTILKKNGVALVSATEPSADDDTSLLTDALFGAMNEMYSRKLSKNIKRGMTDMAKKGKYLVIPPIGYKRDSGKLVIAEEEAKIVRYIFEEYLKGASCWKIARKLSDFGAKTKKGNAFSTRAVGAILRNNTYAGDTYWNMIEVKSTHEAIIDRDMFTNVQERLDDAKALYSRNTRPQEKTSHWLTGILKCCSCGNNMYYRHMYYKKSGKVSSYFKCSAYTRAACPTSNYIISAKLEKLIINYLSEISNPLEVMRTVKLTKRPLIGDEKAVILENLKKIAAKKERAKQGYLNGILELFESKTICADCDGQTEKLENDLAELEKCDTEKLQKDISNLCGTLTNADFTKDEKQTAIRAVIEKIVVNKRDKTLELYFK